MTDATKAEPFKHTYHVPIPALRDAVIRVTYIVGTPDIVKSIAEEIGARETPTWDIPALYEHHYDADDLSPERWILAVHWEHDGIRYSAQSAHTLTPSLVSA